MPTVPYDTHVDPAAPVLPIAIRPPGIDRRVALVALVDSGAQRTVVPIEFAESLGLPPVGEVIVRGATGRSTAAVCAAEIEVDGSAHLVRAVALGSQPLVGRDLLNRWLVTLDGPERQLRLETGFA